MIDPAGTSGARVNSPARLFASLIGTTIEFFDTCPGRPLLTIVGLLAIPETRDEDLNAVR